MAKVFKHTNCFLVTNYEIFRRGEDMWIGTTYNVHRIKADIRIVGSENKYANKS